MAETKKKSKIREKKKKKLCFHIRGIKGSRWMIGFSARLLIGHHRKRPCRLKLQKDIKMTIDMIPLNFN